MLLVWSLFGRIRERFCGARVRHSLILVLEEWRDVGEEVYLYRSRKFWFY